MSEHIELISTLATAFVLALVFGYLVERFLKAPALVGYILAGVAVSTFPMLPEIDLEMTRQFSDVGVMLLMFGVGLHFSVGDLLKVKGVAVPGALIQMMLAAFFGTIFAMFLWDWSTGRAVIFGLSISCASTVVVTKALEIRHLMAQMDGQVAMGWLIVQDLVTVFIMVCLPPFAQVVMGGKEGVDMTAIATQLFLTLGSVVVFVALMLIMGRKLFPLMLQKVAMTGSSELFTLCVLAIAIGIAYVATALFHVSFALGAFFAGMVMRESKFAHRAATNSLPLKDAFAVLFFVAVGLMLDWHIFIDRPLEVLSVVLIILCVTTTVSFSLVVILGWPLHTAFTLAACLAQIGEFSYIMVAQGISLKIADESVMSLIVAASIVSIALNPLVFALIPRFMHRFVTRYRWAKRAAMRSAPMTNLPTATPRSQLHGQVVIAGYNEVVPGIIEALRAANLSVIVVLSAQESVDVLTKQNIPVLVGDITDPMVLVQAHIASAAALILPLRDTIASRKAMAVAQQLNNSVKIVIRCPRVEELDSFDKSENVTVICDQVASSYAMAGYVLEILKIDPDDTEREGEEGEEFVQTGIHAREIFEREYQRIVEMIRGTHPESSNDTVAVTKENS